MPTSEQPIKPLYVMENAEFSFLSVRHRRVYLIIVYIFKVPDILHNLMN